MILKSIRVRQYKNFRDSGEVGIEDGVTCLVGKNESGKSALLQALYRLNPSASGHPETFSGLRDYPRLHYRPDRARISAVRPITATFELGGDDLRAVEEAHGEGVLGSRLVTVARTYDNELAWEIEYSGAVGRAAGGAPPPPPGGPSADGAAGARSEMPSAREPEWPPEPERQRPELPERSGRDRAGGDLDARVRNLLRDRLPKFLYFDDCNVMAGRLSLSRLQHGGERGLPPHERAALSLMRLAAVGFPDFAADDYEGRKVSLEAAANRITDEVLEYWSQDRDLSVEFDLDSGEAGAGAPARFIDVRVRDRRHRITLNFSERSRGFTWFFSFLATLSECSEAGRTILLLDEPGAGLHAEGQRDLRRFFDERLAPAHQVVYTTHSPFMIPAAALRRVRTLEDRKEEGTAVSGDLLEHSAETRSPLRAALGHTLVRSLEVGSDNLIVREPSDSLFLTVMSGHLEKQGRVRLDPRWTIVPAGGLAGASAFAALLGAPASMAVVTGGEDARAGDPPIARAIAADENVIHLPEVAGAPEADVEDLFAEDFYVGLVNRSGAAIVEWFEVLGEGRIVERIRTATGAPYSRYLPARLLLEGGAELLARVDGETLDRFEALFGRINASLGAGRRRGRSAPRPGRAV